jgi:hypothetical protein
MINYFLRVFNSQKVKERERGKKKVETVKNFNIGFVVCSQKIRRMIKDFVLHIWFIARFG